MWDESFIGMKREIYHCDNACSLFISDRYVFINKEKKVYIMRSYLDCKICYPYILIHLVDQNKV